MININNYYYLERPALRIYKPNLHIDKHNVRVYLE